MANERLFLLQFYVIIFVFGSEKGRKFLEECLFLIIFAVCNKRISGRFFKQQNRDELAEFRVMYF